MDRLRAATTITYRRRPTVLLLCTLYYNKAEYLRRPLDLLRAPVPHIHGIGEHVSCANFTPQSRT